MEATTWTAGHPLARWALSEAHAFEFFQLLHLLELTCRGAPALGEQGPAANEAVRLRPAMGLGFPAADLASADWGESALSGRGRIRLTMTFLGLYGSDSPLPTHFTEALLAEKEDDERVREFIDLFHHRVYSLLYRVWKKYRYYVTFRSDGHDPISEIVRGLLGIGTAHLDGGLSIHPVKLFRYVGLHVQRPRSASGLVGELKAYFETIPVDLEPCVGRWLWIDPAERNVMGLGKCTLGTDFLVGERIFDRSGKFRVKLGPVGFEDYSRFLPTGSAAAELAQIVKLYCGDPLDFDIQVTLKGDEVPDLPLRGQGFLGRLSWTSWLKSKPCGDKSAIFSVPSGQPAAAATQQGGAS